MSIRTIRDRLEKLEELTLQCPGVAVILPTEDGFIASRGDGKAARLCNTLGEAQQFCAACETTIIIDV